MRFSSALLLALPALALAEDQVPLADKLKGWFNKATQKASEYVPSAAPTPKAPVNAGAAAKVAEYTVQPLNNNNWQSVLKPSEDATASEPETWMIFLTGGNKTCYGLCGNITKEWNKAVTLLAPLPDRPRLGTANCDDSSLLCGSWNAGVPSIWHFQIPHARPDQPMPDVTARKIHLNRVNSTAADIVALHADRKFEEYEPYTGLFHPFNGLMHEFGVAIPYAYVLRAFGAMPQWVPMVVISFVSRSFMGRRAPPARGGGAAPPARGS